MKQINRKIIKGTIEVVTGLHIGADNNKVEIGGMDNPVVRNPLTREPYIPGSSIKGKMRALLEWEMDKIDKGIENPKHLGDPCSCGLPECPICRIFGCGNNSRNTEKAKLRGPTRFIVRDALLSKANVEQFCKGEPIIEEKSENSLNRITAAANPRPIERVVPGIKFDFELVYRILDTGDGGKRDTDFFTSVVQHGLSLLQNDYLGGGGSRGNGRIKFTGLKVFDEQSKKETDLTLEEN